MHIRIDIGGLFQGLKILNRHALTLRTDRLILSGLNQDGGHKSCGKITCSRHSEYNSSPRSQAYSDAKSGSSIVWHLPKTVKITTVSGSLRDAGMPGDHFRRIILRLSVKLKTQEIVPNSTIRVLLLILQREAYPTAV